MSIKLAYKLIIGVGTLAAAITGTTIAVKKNEALGKAWDKQMPDLFKKSCKATETKTVAASKATGNMFRNLWKSNVAAFRRAKEHGFKAGFTRNTTKTHAEPIGGKKLTTI
jgi:hypothetical protein